MLSEQSKRQGKVYEIEKRSDSFIFYELKKQKNI